MSHIQPDLMQRFLADEVDLMQREAVVEHLAHCGDCAALLAELTAEDDSLSAALELDALEADWVAQTDLTAPVLRRIRPWYQEPGFVTLLLLITATGIWAAGRVAEVLTSPLRAGGPVGLVINLMQGLVPALWTFARFVLQGGLLTTMWPVLALAAAAGLWRLRSRKEVNEDA